MERKTKIEFCRKYYKDIVEYGVVSPVIIKNLCILLNIPHGKKSFVMFYMLQEPRLVYDREHVQTPKETKQCQYMAEHIGDDLSQYISELEAKVFKPWEKPPKKGMTMQDLDNLFTAADADEIEDEILEMDEVPGWRGEFVVPNEEPQTDEPLPMKITLSITQSMGDESTKLLETHSEDEVKPVKKRNQRSNPKRKM